MRYLVQEEYLLFLRTHSKKKADIADTPRNVFLRTWGPFSWRWARAHEPHTLRTHNRGGIGARYEHAPVVCGAFVYGCSRPEGGEVWCLKLKYHGLEKARSSQQGLPKYILSDVGNLTSTLLYCRYLGTQQ